MCLTRSRKHSLPVTHKYIPLHPWTGLQKTELKLLWRTEPWVDFILTQCLSEALFSFLEKSSLLKHSLLNSLLTVTMKDLNGFICMRLVSSKTTSLERHTDSLKRDNVWQTLHCFRVTLQNAGWKFRNLKSKMGSSNIAVTITMKESKYRNGLPFTCLGGLLYLTMIQTQRVVLGQWALLSHVFPQRYDMMTSATVSDDIQYKTYIS